MAASNDFFVKFGSNASIWARGLEKELAPANRAIQNTELLLNRLERKGKGTASNIQRAFAQDLDNRGRTQGTGATAGSGPMPTGLVSNLDKAASQLYNITDQLESTVRAIQGIPDVVKRALRSANGSINQGDGYRPDQNVGAGSRFTKVTDPLAVNAIVASAMKRNNALGTPSGPTAPISISGAGSQAVLEAGMRRIVTAIETQTQKLTSALGSIQVEATPGTSAAAAPSASRPARTSKPAAEPSEQEAVAQMISGMRAQVEEAKTVRAQMEGMAQQRLAALAAEHGVESKIYKDEKTALDAALSSQRATLAKMERIADGTTRTDQTAVRKEDAAKAAAELAKLPVISEQEIQRRQREQSLIRSTQDPNFLTSVGRKKDDYGKSDLNEMARALKDVGIDAGLKSRDDIGTMALKLAEAGERYQRVFNDTLPESLKTEGFQKPYRETELPNTLRQLLSQANDDNIQAYARQREEDRQILSKSFQGGDSGDLSRGRRNFGSNLLPGTLDQPQNIPGGRVVAGQYTEQEIREASDRLKRSPNHERDTALDLIRQSGFDPYDRRVTQGLQKGNTPDERRKAEDALLFVRHLRDATTEIDKSGQAYVSAGRKIQALDRLIGYVNKQLAADGLAEDADKMSRTQRRFLEERRETYQEGRTAQEGIRSGARRSAKSMGFGNLLDDPQYRADLAARGQSRRGYETNVQRLKDSTPTLSDSQTLREGIGNALRQAMGQDFRFNSNNGRIGRADNDLSRNDANELNSAFNGYISALRQVADLTRRGAQGPELARAESRFENQTVGLLNQLEKGFNGFAPKFEALATLGLDKAGYPLGTASDEAPIRRIQNPDNASGEARREDRRRQIQSDLDALKALKGASAAELMIRRVDAVTASRTKEQQAVEATVAAQKRYDDAVKKRASSLTDAEKADVRDAKADLERRTAERRLLEEGVQFGSTREPSTLAAQAAVDKINGSRAFGPATEKVSKQLDEASQDLRVAQKAQEDHRAATAANAAKMVEYNAAVDRELKARDAVTKLEGGDSKQIAGLAASRQELGKAQHDATIAYKQDVGSLRALVEDRAAGLVESRRAKLKETRVAGSSALNADGSPSGPLGELFNERTQKLREAEAELSRVRGLGDADLLSELASKRKTEKPAVAKATPTADDTAAVRKIAEGEAAKLKAERERIQKSGDPYTRTAKNALAKEASLAEAAVAGRRGAALKGAITRATNKNDEDALKAAKDNLAARQKEAAEARKAAEVAAARYNRVREINARLKEIDDGGAGGGAKPPTGGGSSVPTGGGPGDNSILSRILTAVNSINKKLSSGIKVTGGTSKAPASTVPTAATAAAPKTPRNTRMTDEERTRRDSSLAAQRAVEDEARLAAVSRKSQNLEASRNRERQKTDEQLRENQRNTERMAAAENLLTRSTLEQIEALRRLNAVDTKNFTNEQRAAQQRAISDQQVKTYGAMERDLLDNRVLGTDRRAIQQNVLSTAGPEISANELNSIARTARANNPNMMLDRGLAAGVPKPEQSEWMQAWGNGLFGNKGFWGRIVGSTGAFIVRNFAAGAVFGLTAGLQQVLDQALQTEMTFVRVSQALEATGKPLGSLRADLGALSTDYGVQLNDVYTSAASLQGLFSGTQDLAIGTRVSTQLQVISNGALNATEAVGVLASIYSAFQNDVDSNLSGTDGLQRIADTLTLIQNELGVNVETSAEGVSSLAGAAQSMGLSFQETAVYASQIAKLTNQSGAAAGEQFSRILGTTLTGRGQNVLRDTFEGLVTDDGFDLGAAMDSALSRGDQGDVIQNLMLGWNDLTKAQQDNIAVVLAGQRQMRSFQALMHDTENTTALLTKAYNANGDAEDRMAALMDTLNKKVDKLVVNFQNFALALIESGILNFFEDLLSVTNKVFENMNQFFGYINAVAKENALVGMLRDMITWSIGAAVAFKILGASVGGLRGALRSMRIEGAEATPNTLRPPLPNSPLGSSGAQGNVPYGPVTRRENQEARVERPRLGSYGPTGIGRFAIDRVLRVPFERTGRIIDRGGARWEKSNNRFIAALGKGSTQVGTTMGNLSNSLREGAQTAGRYDSRTGRMLDGGASRLDAFAASRMSRADEATSRYRDQRAFEIQRGLGGVGDPQGLVDKWQAQGMSFGDQARRQGGSDPNLLRQANANKILAATAAGASTVMSTTSSAFKGIASSGLAADAALVGLGLAIAAVVQWRAQIKDLEDTATRAAEAYEAEEDPGNSDPEDWMGDATKKINTQVTNWEKDGSSIGDRFVNAFTKRGIASSFEMSQFDKESREFIPASELAIAQEKIGLANKPSTDVGDDFRARLAEMAKPGETNPLAFRLGNLDLAGSDETGALYSEYMDKINKAASGQMGSIPEALAETNAEFEADLVKMAQEVENDPNLTGGQKTAWLALIEALDGTITDEVASRGAIVAGLQQGLNSDQLGALTKALATANTIRENPDSGLDGILNFQMSDIGLEDGDLQERMDRVRDEGISVAQATILNLKILQDAAKAARANWLAEMEKDPESDAAKEADSQLSALMGALDELGSSAVETIVNEAEGLAVAAEQAGQYAKAARIRLQAMKDADRAQGVVDGDQGTQPAANPLDDVARGLRGAKAARPGGPDAKENQRGKKNRAAADPALIAGFENTYRTAVFLATKDITLQIARTSDAAKRAALEMLNAQIVASIDLAVSSGSPINGQLQADLADKAPGVIDDLAPVAATLDAGSKSMGEAVVSQQQVHDSQVSLASAQTGYADAQSAAAEEAKSGAGDAAAKAAEARQNAAALKQAQLGVAQAAADARGDAVASARIQVAMAKAQIAAARAELGAAKTASESAQARIAILNAQAQLIAASAAVQSAQTDLVQSQYSVSIAMAEAAGKTVLAAERQLGAARAALKAAQKRSGGKATAEVNQARATLISAQASARDAALQDQLDTIDFNLEMGKMTQSAAISALQEILRTSDLTKAQRRQLMLQIKGMKDEMGDSQWNFGDIRLPTPYQMRRYITERRQQFAGELEQAATGAGGGKKPNRKDLDFEGNKVGSAASNNTSNQTTIYINGADIGKVKRVIQEVVGGSGSINTRTTGARRNR